MRRQNLVRRQLKIILAFAIGLITITTGTILDEAMCLATAETIISFAVQGVVGIGLSNLFQSRS